MIKWIREYQDDLIAMFIALVFLTAISIMVGFSALLWISVWQLGSL
jgi:hypothetical protein